MTSMVGQLERWEPYWQPATAAHLATATLRRNRAAVLAISPKPTTCPLNCSPNSRATTISQCGRDPHPARRRGPPQRRRAPGRTPAPGRGLRRRQPGRPCLAVSPAQSGVQLTSQQYIKGWDVIHNGCGMDALEEHIVRQLRLWCPDTIVTNNTNPPAPINLVRSSAVPCCRLSIKRPIQLAIPGRSPTRA